MSICSQFQLDELVELKKRIVILRTAVFELAMPGVTSYTFNSGQTVQTVTRADVGKLEATIRTMTADAVVQEAACNGSNVRQVVPGW